MQKITTCLWFDNNAEEAVSFYTSVFKNSKVLEVSRYGEAGPGPAGSVLTIRFQLERATAHLTTARGMAIIVVAAASGRALCAPATLQKGE